MVMSRRTVWVAALFALAALVVWPWFIERRMTLEARAALPTPAPVIADYASREQVVSFYERDAKAHPDDQIIARLLATQYLQRFRERNDVGDLLRAQAQAQHSLALQPRNNIAADMTMASALLSLHQFRSALRYAHEAERIEPWNPAAKAQEISLQTELGRYDVANRLLRHPPPGMRRNDVWDGAQARYDEMTGGLAHGRRLIDRAMADIDAVMDNPAETRAWYHMRSGELAFSAGDYATAEQRFNEALVIFPSDAKALSGLARLAWAQARWPEALRFAARASDLLPTPETLGYEADAQRALGDRGGAAQTEDLMGAIERVGNARGINDRALAVYYAEHREHLADALRIARRDLAARDDVYAEDTLAWALAANGRWREARIHASQATRFNTEDARLQFHAAIIALENGDAEEGRRRLEFALRLSPKFHPKYAEQAKLALAKLAGREEPKTALDGDKWH